MPVCLGFQTIYSTWIYIYRILSKVEKSEKKLKHITVYILIYINLNKTLHDKRILYPEDQLLLFIGFSDSWCSEIFSVCLHSVRPSAHTDESLASLLSVTITAVTAGIESDPECNATTKLWLLRLSMAETMKAAQLRPQHHCWQAVETVKANNGLHWSTSHDKVNNPC